MLRARFEDAQFFYRADLGTRLEAMRARLAGTLFHKDLGSLLAKAERVERLVAPLAAASGLAGAPSPLHNTRMYFVYPEVLYWSAWSAWSRPWRPRPTWQARISLQCIAGRQGPLHCMFTSSQHIVAPCAVASGLVACNETQPNPSQAVIILKSEDIA